eukprot:6440060-Prymnesium_polylepis.1
MNAAIAHPSASSRIQPMVLQYGSQSSTYVSECSTGPLAPPWTTMARGGEPTVQHAWPPRSAGGLPLAVMHRH